MGPNDSYESLKIQSALERVETSLKELQVVVTDVAVVKSEMSSMKEDLQGIYKFIFNGTDPRGSIVDRTTRAEEAIRDLQKIDIHNRISSLERDTVKVESCKKVHDAISSKFWRFMIPVMVAFALAAATVIFNDIYSVKSHDNQGLENQTNSMRLLIREELKGFRNPTP